MLLFPHYVPHHR
jgi:hypothetical protein